MDIHQIDIGQFVHILTIASFMLFICTTFVLVAQAMGMSRKKVSHLETLPLDEPADHE